MKAPRNEREVKREWEGACGPEMNRQHTLQEEGRRLRKEKSCAREERNGCEIHSLSRRPFLSPPSHAQKIVWSARLPSRILFPPNATARRMSHHHGEGCGHSHSHAVLREKSSLSNYHDARVSHISIDSLVVDFAASKLVGRVSYTVKVLAEEGASEVVLDTKDLLIKSVSCDGASRTGGR